MCSERRVQVFSNMRANFIFFQQTGPIIQSVPIPQFLRSSQCLGHAEGALSLCQKRAACSQCFTSSEGVLVQPALGQPLLWELWSGGQLLGD